MSRTWLWVALSLCHPAQAQCQSAREVPRPQPSEGYVELRASLTRLGEDAADEALRLWATAGDSDWAPEERFDLLFWELAPRLARSRAFPELLELLRAGQAQGVFYPWDDRPYPAYQSHLESLPGYAAFVRDNLRLRRDAQAEATTTYHVQLPAGYDGVTPYPLVMILHGGSGSLRDLLGEWPSSLLASECIVAYVQGSVRSGTNRYSYPRDDHGGILAAYRQVMGDYAVDPARVFLAGQSAGGNRALTLALDGHIPAAGLLLAFPAVSSPRPRERLQRAATGGLRIVMVTGDEDRGIDAQRALARALDEVGLPNRLVVVPEVGHWFPPDFPDQVDRGLRFLMGWGE